MTTTTKRGRKKGTPKTGGRKKGTPNKLTRSVKDAIENSFWAIGGQAYLERISKEDPRTYLTLLGKVVPSQIQSDVDLKVKTHEEWLRELGAFEEPQDAQDA